MSKQIRLNQEHAKSDPELIKALQSSAQKYVLYADQKLLYIYHSNIKDAPYEDYEVFFGKENFIHLVGFKKGLIGAVEFFEQCCNNIPPLDKVFFKENRKAASAKLDVLPLLLDYCHIKMYKMGHADLITEKNRFEIGLGNYSGIIGFDQRTPAPALPVPVTVMKRPITDYVSKPQNVVAILMKEKNATYYDTVVGCVSKGLTVSDLPISIQKKLSPSLAPVIFFNSQVNKA